MPDTSQLGDQVLEELRRVAFAKVSDIVALTSESFSEDGAPTLEFSDFSSLPPELLSCISSVKMGTRGIEIRLYDKLRALYYLGIFCGLFDRQKPTQMSEVSIFDDL